MFFTHHTYLPAVTQQKRTFTITLPAKIVVLPRSQGQRVRRVRTTPWRRIKILL